MMSALKMQKVLAQEVYCIQSRRSARLQNHNRAVFDDGLDADDEIEVLDPLAMDPIEVLSILKKKI